MKTNRMNATVLITGIAALAAAGCVKHEVVYVPAPPPPAYQGQPAPPPPAYAVQPVPPPAVVVAPSAPPAAQVEVVPVAPGPAYVWVPGYYSWRNGWVWVGGSYVMRPRPGAVWVKGYWARHGHGWAWRGGYWR